MSASHSGHLNHNLTSLTTFISPFAATPTSPSPPPPRTPRRPRFSLRFPFFNLSRSKPPPSPSSIPPPSESEWQDLVIEFEDRAPPRSSATPPPLPSDPAFTDALRSVECAFMTALTTTIWYFGRILRLDSIFLLFYPIPTMYIAARWGLRDGDVTLATTVMFIFLTVGPLYAILFVFNSGFLAATYARGVWYGWPFWGLLLAGGLAKGVGLVMTIKWTGLVLRYDTWKLVTFQTRTMLKAIVRGFNWLCRSKVLAVPSVGAVQWGVAAVVVLHSLYHVFCTLLVASLFLRSAAKDGRLERAPPQVPGMEWLLTRSRRSIK